MKYVTLSYCDSAILDDRRDYEYNIKKEEAGRKYILQPTNDLVSNSWNLDRCNNYSLLDTENGFIFKTKDKKYKLDYEDADMILTLLKLWEKEVNQKTEITLLEVTKQCRI